jgi:D-3-phosphoglycerate dehydrogenase / 2-oxoglutarate reductase
MAEALSIKVLFFDTVSLMPIGNAVSVNTLEELLQNSDFVSVNVSSLPENKHLISKPQLDIMKKGSFLINTSYGDAVDGFALADAIKSGHLGGAAIDAHPESNTPGNGSSKFTSPLQNVRNVILTPNYGNSGTVNISFINNRIFHPCW